MLAAPADEEVLNPRELLEAEDVERESRVPLNPRQFESIRRIGVDRMTLIQGPPGTGKSTTIFNGIKYRLPDEKQAIITAVTNQAVAAVLDKLVRSECYIPLQDDNQPVRDAPPGRFSFVLCGNKERYEDVPSAGDFHVDAITNRLVDERDEVKETTRLYEDFKAGCKSPDQLLATYEDLRFFKGFKDETRRWRRCLKEYVLDRRRPDYESFAGQVLGRKVFPGGDGDEPSRVTFEADKCNSFEDMRKISLEYWAQHVQLIRNKHFRELKEHVIINSDVVLCTIDTLHNKSLRIIREGGRLHSVYIDEASLVPEEAMAIVGLYDPTTLILIGDHKQLRPFSNFDLNLTKGEDGILARSFFERCISVGVRYTMLQKNYRNPPQLVKILNVMTYDGGLIPAKTRGPGHIVEWIDHSFDESDAGDSSKRNIKEADEVRRLYRRVRAEISGSIMIITFYKGQWRQLRDTVKLQAGDRICTVDSCQGTEASAVILSCVRSNSYGGVGFTSHPNRLNVAISRAKDRLYIVGNKSTFALWRKCGELLVVKNPLWTQLIDAIHGSD
jgi:hypothetical protein